MKREEVDVNVQFNFETGTLILTFSDGTTHTYDQEEGYRIAQRFDRYVEKAIKDYIKQIKARKRLADMN